MRYPNDFHENIDHPETHEGEQSEQGRHPRGHGHFHRVGAGRGRVRGLGHGQRCEQHQDREHQHRSHNHEGERPTDTGHEGRRPTGTRHEGRGREAHGHEEHGQPGEHPRGGAHRHPTLARSIMKSARRIRQSDLTPEQLHRRIAATVSHADYMTTMRTLRRIGMELRPAPADAER